MSKRVTFTPEEKYKSVKKVLNGEISCNAERNNLNISFGTLNNWIRKYELNGYDGLIESNTWKYYSEELKRKAVQSVLSERYSLEKAKEIYNISSNSVLKRWIDKYTGNDKIKSTSKGNNSIMTTPGRKTTFKERVEIVQFALVHDKDYLKAIDKYQVSYQQIYSWVKKYEISGPAALQDKRGRTKIVEELTEVEKLNLRIKELEAKNQQLEMEVTVQKKLKEIQDRYLR